MGIRGLLEGLGLPPADAVERDRAFRQLYREAVAVVSAKWIEGTYDYVEEHCPELDQELRRTEDRLNEVWINGRVGKAGMEDFKKALKEWETSRLQAIELNARRTNGH